MFMNAHAEPSINETVTFIQKVIKSDTKSSVESDGDYTYHKPILTFDSTSCIIKAVVYKSRDAKKYYRKTYYLDLTKQTTKIYTSTTDNDISIYVQDRQNINTIKKINETLVNNRFKVRGEEMDYATFIPFHPNGVYYNKVDKALKHLSKLCFEKYGVEENDPF